MRDDDDSNWPKQLMVGLGALLAAALVIGGVTSLVALGAANFAGVGSGSAGATREPSLYIPPRTSPSGTASAPQESGEAESPDDSATTGTAAPKQEKAKKKKRPLTLQARPRNASSGERIYLTGRYRGGNGAVLQVQRREGGSWSAFPVTATVRGGRFETWIQSSREGAQRFRVLDRSTGRTSRPVTVRIQ